MSTYVLIEKYTVGAGGASSVTLGSGGTIPQTYTDLKIVASIRSDYSSTNNFLKLTVNGNTTSLSNRFIYFFNTTVNSTSYGSPANSICGTINGATSTSNTFSNFEMYAPNYTSSNYKSVLVYVNGTLLTYGRDYTVAPNAPRLTVLIPLAVGDQIVINEYAATYGNFVPNTPTKMEGKPSSRNNHSQPLKPPMPFMNCMMAPETGAPITLEMAIAVMNSAMVLARRALGNQ